MQSKKKQNTKAGTSKEHGPPNKRDQMQLVDLGTADLIHFMVMAGILYVFFWAQREASELDIENVWISVQIISSKQPTPIFPSAVLYIRDGSVFMWEPCFLDHDELC
jgi:hypothetical protein